MDGTLVDPMGRKSKTQQFIEIGVGQHLALSVAAHLARTQLVPDPLAVYDAQHIIEMVDAVGNALIRVTPVCIREAQDSAPRQLIEAELEGAKVTRGATLLVLKDGRTLSRVSVKRADLRQAIAILKAVGVQELARARPAAPSKPGPRDRTAELRASLAQVEQLLRPPLVPVQVDRASALIVSIARNAPQGRVANLAMRLMSAVHQARAEEASADERQIELQLARLRAALEQAEDSGTEP